MGGGSMYSFMNILSNSSKKFNLKIVEITNEKVISREHLKEVQIYYPKKHTQGFKDCQKIKN